MAKLIAVIDKNGGTQIDIQMNIGQECSNTDARLSAMLQIMGIKLEDIADAPLRAVPQTNGNPLNARQKT